MAVITIQNIFAAGNKIVAEEVNDNFGTFKTFIEANCVQTDGTIKATTDSLNNLCVTTAKLGDLSVSSGKIIDLAVITSKINDLAVTTAKLNDLAVTNAKIADATITGGKFASSLSPVYLSATTAGLPTTDGTIAYINNNSSTEGIQIYSGVAWRKPWNLPWGFIDYRTVINTQTGITTVQDVTGADIAFTGVANRLYKITVVTSRITSTVAGDRVDIRLVNVNGGVDICSAVVHCPVAASAGTTTLVGILPSNASISIKVTIARASGTGTIATNASPTSPFLVYIEDVGPAGNPA